MLRIRPEKEMRVTELKRSFQNKEHALFLVDLRNLGEEKDEHYLFGTIREGKEVFWRVSDLERSILLNAHVFIEKKMTDIMNAERGNYADDMLKEKP